MARGEIPRVIDHLPGISYNKRNKNVNTAETEQQAPHRPESGGNMITLNLYYTGKPGAAKAFAEEAIHVAVALTEEHAGRHDEDIGKDIEQTDIQQTQHGYQTTMHRARAKGCSCPLFLT